MAQEFRKREEEEELIRSFEEILKKKSSVFFDLEAYETIIYYYLDRAKHKKALAAVSMAMAQYPFSTELIAVKAQILSNLQQYDEALELLERLLHAAQAGKRWGNVLEILVLQALAQQLRGDKYV